MSDSNLAALAIRAYRDVQIEMGMDPSNGQVLFPALSEALERISNLPDDSLLLGIAADGLPLLLQLRDSRPGPVLLLGEKGSGKTEFLQVLLHSPHGFSVSSATLFAVLTGHPSEFDDIPEAENFLGVWASYAAETADMLYQLACRVQYPMPSAPVLLLLDGLENVLQLDESAQENLAYILTYGPQSLVWPIVTLNSEMALKIPQWLAYFRTRIFGRITNPHTAETLTKHPGAALDSLFPGSQFCLRRNGKWLKFWLPNI